MTPKELPAKIGRYEIRQELGRGMMGVVYEAHDPALGRRIALKTIRLAFAVSEEERRSFEERFLTEARVAARLSHPGIVVVHDVGQDPDGGTLFIALEYLVGRTLAEVVSEGQPLDWPEALRITKRVAEALHHAHAQGVIHRDVKPANIMILESGEPKIMDFGIAKVESSQLTAAGQFFGTPLYMSPEQALGRPLDARSDLFSLGTLAYGLLTGQQAFGGSGLPRILTRVLHEDPPPPTHVVRSLPPDIDYFVARAVAKDPADRYADGRAMAEDADDILSRRPPRHRQGWTEPHRAEGTLVSSPGQALLEAGHDDSAPSAKPGSAASMAAARPARTATAPRQRGAERPFPWTTILVAAVLGGAAVAGGLHLMRGRTEPDAPAATMPPTAAATPETAPAPAAPDSAPPVSPAPATTLLAESPAAEETPTPPAPPPATVERAAARAKAPPATEPPAQLAVDFEHSLKDGTLRIWVDDALVVEEALDSRVTKKVVALKFRKGSVEETLELNPGPHEVKVQVAWDDNVKTRHISGHFASGTTRRLSATLGVGMRGFVRKDLKLQWE